MKRLIRMGWLAGLAASVALSASIYLGSHALKHFDPALVWYAVGSVFAAFAVGYRFTRWAQRPPARMYFLRGLQLLFRRGVPAHPNPLPSAAAPQPSRKGSSNNDHRTSNVERKVRSSMFDVGRWTFLQGKNLPADPEPDRRVSKGEGRGERVQTVAPLAASSVGSKRTATLILVKDVAGNFVAQSFIRRRSLYRWIMHSCLSGGCTLAFAVTFPLVFGWVHFESFADNAEIYRVAVFGLEVGSLDVHSAAAFVAFNLLNFSAIIVLVGLIMAAARRLTNAGERATQKFTEDILPLLLIFAVTVTGLMLTVSYKFLAGRSHGLIAVAHMISVIALLGFIPFGKLFHMFQRVCSLCVSLYRQAGEAGPRAHCLRCGEDFASQMHVADLKTVLDQLGFNYRFATAQGEIHYQDICPLCRRRLLGLNHGRTVGR